MAMVIYSIDWFLHAERGGFRANTGGSAAFKSPDPESFIAFGSVTQKMMEEWVAASIGEEVLRSLHKTLADTIEFQEHPPVISVAVPWGE